MKPFLYSSLVLLIAFLTDANGQLITSQPITASDSLLERIGYNNNVFSVQLMGDTPYLGLKYGYRLYSSPKVSFESGAGGGYRPTFILFKFFLPDYRQYTVSHYHTVSFLNTGFVNPYVGYSGVGINNIFFNANKTRLKYVPTLHTGVRFGWADILRGSVGFIGGLSDKIGTADPKTQETVYARLPIITLSANIQIPF